MVEAATKSDSASADSPGARPADPKEQMTLCLNVLQEYAKWCLLRGYVPPEESEARRVQLLRQLFEVAPLLNLTDRDAVWLLYNGLFNTKSED